MQTGGPATAPGWDSGNSRGDTVGDPVAPAVPRQADPRGFRKGWRDRGPSSSRFVPASPPPGSCLATPSVRPRESGKTRPRVPIPSCVWPWWDGTAWHSTVLLHPMAPPSTPPGPSAQTPPHPTQDPKMLPPGRAPPSPLPGAAGRGCPALGASSGHVEVASPDSKGWRAQEGKLRHREAMLAGGSGAAAGPHGQEGPGASCHAKGHAQP